MMRHLLPLGVGLMCAVSTQSQVVFTGRYTQDFDALGASSGVLPEGWSAVRHAGSGTVGAALSPGVSTGTSTGGGIYNVGLSAAIDRALGSLSSSSTVPRFGLQLLNGSGSTLSSLRFEAVLEQWRSGSSTSAAERLGCEFSLDAVDISDPAATWVSLAEMDLYELLTETTSAAAVDGTLAANQAVLRATAVDLNWLDGATLTLRWTDRDDAGSDGMYAVDDLVIQGALHPVPEPGGIGLALLGLGALVLARGKRVGTV